MEIKTLTGIDIQDILEAFNSSFTTYFVPLQFTEEQLLAKLKNNNVNLDISIGIFKEGKLIAFILNAEDILRGEKVVYNAATGVISEERSKGLTKKMYDFIKPVLVEKQYSYSVLEVISENHAALKSYESSGFYPYRELLCYHGKPDVLRSNSDIEIQEIKNCNWELMESFWDVSPSWQNLENSINREIDKLIILGGFLEGQQIAYLVFSPEKNRIIQIAVHKEHRKKGVAGRLVKEVLVNHGPSLSLINLDENGDSIKEFLKDIGMEYQLKQIEMKMDIALN